MNDSEPLEYAVDLLTQVATGKLGIPVKDDEYPVVEISYNEDYDGSDPPRTFSFTVTWKIREK